MQRVTWSIFENSNSNSVAVAQWTKRNENKGSCFESNKNKFESVQLIQTTIAPGKVAAEKIIVFYADIMYGWVENLCEFSTNEEKSKRTHRRRKKCNAFIPNTYSIWKLFTVSALYLFPFADKHSINQTTTLTMLQTLNIDTEWRRWF